MFNRPLKLYLVDVYFKEQHNGEINNCIIYISPFRQLNALHAPVWKLKAKGNDFAQTALSKSLKSLLALSQQRSNSTKQIIRSLSSGESVHNEQGMVITVFNRI